MCPRRSSRGISKSKSTLDKRHSKFKTEEFLFVSFAMLTRHIMSRQMLIEAESHRLLMQNTHSVAVEQCGGPIAKNLQRSGAFAAHSAGFFSISRSRTHRCGRVFAAPPASRKTRRCHRRHADKTCGLPAIIAPSPFLTRFLQSLFVNTKCLLSHA